MREIIPHPIAWVDVQRHAEPLVRQFLQLRGIASLWLRQPAHDRVGDRAMYYRFQHSAATTPIWTHRYTQAYAGSFWHALWVVSSGGGRMRESRDKGDGGELHTPGFVCSTVWGCAHFYAWATQLFDDGLFYAIVYDIMVDTACLNRTNQHKIGKHNHEMFLPTSAVWMRGMWVVLNKHVLNKDPRFWRWDPSHEFVPDHADVVPPVRASHRARSIAMMPCD